MSTAKPELCRHCGQPLGAARLIVTADSSGGPRGSFHIGGGENCYMEALAQHESRKNGRAGTGAVVAGQSGALDRPRAD